MNRNVQTPKSRVVLVGLCVAVLFLWAVAVYVTYQDTKMARYNVSIKPGAVNYGTHSTVTMPPVMRSSYHHSTPMISGDAVRAYAHAGHATMPTASYGSSSGFRIHTTSSATVHSIGGGGSTGGGMMSSGGGGSSSRGIRYSGGSVSMPILAVNSSMMAAPSTSGTSASLPVGPRRAQPTVPGDYDGEWSDAGAEDGNWYRWDDWAGVWVPPTEGDTRIEGGVTYKWNGTSWDPIGDQGDPGVPVGATPWILMLLLAGAYALRLRIKSRKYTNQ